MDLNKKIGLGYILTALLAIAIGGVDNRKEEMVAILIAVMIFSIGCSLDGNKINECYKDGFFSMDIFSFLCNDYAIRTIIIKSEVI